MKMVKKLYWLGNSAKTKIINEVLQKASEKANKDILVFDYGCGNGGDWHNILADFANIQLIGYDPYPKSIKEAKERLQGFNVKLLTGNELQELEFKAQFIISFSVFEHVYDRKTYLQTVKKHLANEGTVYLNYDDGHFRNYLDLNRPDLWFSQVWEHIHNFLVHPLAKLGKTAWYQKRVERLVIDQLITELGFKAVDVYYNNLSNLKGLYKTIPIEQRESFTKLWLSVEDELNEKFLIEGQLTSLGDTSNLWQFMGSRTVVLKHQ